jgi:rhodanese-related sulfurtransferase
LRSLQGYNWVIIQTWLIDSTLVSCQALSVDVNDKNYRKNVMSRKHTQKPTKKTQIPWLWIGAALVIFIVVGVLAFQPFGGAPTTASTAPTEVSVTEAAQKYEAGVIMLDVREPEEWEQFHIPGATLIPLGELPARVDELPRDQEIVVVCRTGNRSQQGRDILLDAGYQPVSSMAGGMVDWQAQGYPTVNGP